MKNLKNAKRKICLILLLITSIFILTSCDNSNTDYDNGSYNEINYNIDFIDHDCDYYIAIIYTNRNSSLIGYLFDEDNNLVGNSPLLNNNNSVNQSYGSYFKLKRNKNYNLKIFGKLGYYDIIVSCNCKKKFYRLKSNFNSNNTSDNFDDYKIISGAGKDVENIVKKDNNSSYKNELEQKANEISNFIKNNGQSILE